MIFKPVTLTQAQTKSMDAARLAFMDICPFFAQVYYSIGEEVFTRDFPTACTDGKRIYINPDYFCQFKVLEQVFILAHEVDHMVCSHPVRMKHYARQGTVKGKPFDPNWVNICMDYVINARLVRTGVGTINPSWLLEPSVTGEELWEDVYDRLYNPPPPTPQPPPQGGQGSPQPPPQGKTPKSTGKSLKGAKGDPVADAQGGAFDQVLEPAEDLPSDHEIKEAVARAAALAKAMGKLPADFQRLVDEILDPQIDWREHIRLVLTGKVGNNAETWAKPNRRRLALNPLVIIPGKRGYGCELVVVGVDTSGSIAERELSAFFAEVGGILNAVRPKRIVVIGCDAEVSQVDEVRSLDEFQLLRSKGIRGGGGTDFRPVFDYVRDNNLQPETLVYLTDGYGAFPDTKPAYPTIWAMTTDEKAPWGDVVRIKVS
jgi:predicted metal-dependent peptidase